MEKRKRFYVALALYAVLGVAIWMTVDNIPIPVRVPDRLGWLGSVHITLREVTLAVLAVFVVRTVLHWRAEQIQAEREREQGSELM